MDKKLGRPQRLSADSIKKPCTVSLTDKERAAIESKYNTLTAALIAVYKKIR